MWTPFLLFCKVLEWVIDYLHKVRNSMNSIESDVTTSSGFKDSKKNSWWQWKLSAEELSEQVSGYNSLRFNKTARGICVIFFGTLNILTIIATYFLDIPVVSFQEAMVEIFFIYVPLLFFVYKGHRWAMYSILVIWSIDKAVTINYQLSTGGFALSSIIFLILGISVCARAIQVENNVRKDQKNRTGAIIS